MYYVYADGESIYNPLDETLGIVSPKVSLELGKAGSFQFDLPPTNTYYNRLSQLKTIVTVYLDDTEIFRGRVFSIERKFNKMKTVYCEGVLAYLVDSVQKAKTYKGKAHAFFKKIISGHNTMMGTVSAEKKFTVGNIEIEDADVIIPGKKDDDDKYYGSKYAQAIIESIVDEWLTTFDYINDVLIDYLGGYLVARYSNGKNVIDYISADSLDKSIIQAESSGVGYKEIEFGTNLIDLTEEINAEELFTVLIPLGDDNLTVKSVNKNSIEIVDEAAVAKYGRIVKTHVFDNVNSASTLLSDGKKYLKAHKNIPVSFTVRALDMHFIDESNQIIEIGEVVKVKSNPHDISRMLICTKIEYDLQNPANNTYTFGNPKQSMTERYKKNKDKEKKESKKHTSSGGGAGAGAAAADAEEAAEEIIETFNPTKVWVDNHSQNLETTLQFYTDNSAALVRTKEWVSNYGAYAEKTIQYYTKNSGGIIAAKDWVDAYRAQSEKVIAFYNNNAKGIITSKDWVSHYGAYAEKAIQYYTRNSGGLIATKNWVDAYRAQSEKVIQFYNSNAGGIITSKNWVSRYAAYAEKVIQYYTQNSGGLIATKNWVNAYKAQSENVMKFYSGNAGGLITAKKWIDGYGSYVNTMATYKIGDKKVSYADIALGATRSKAFVDLVATYDSKTASFSIKADKDGTLVKFVADQAKAEVKKLDITGTVTSYYAESKTSLTVGDNIYAGNIISGKTLKCSDALNMNNGATAQLPSPDNIKIFTGSGNKTLEKYIESVIDSEYINSKITSTAVLAAIKNQSIQPSAINTGTILATEISLGTKKNHKMWATYKDHKHDFSTSASFSHQHQESSGSYTKGPKNGSNFTVSGTTAKP